MNHIKYQNSQKLHISKTPSISSWILTLGVSVLNVLIINTESIKYIVKAITVLIFLIFTVYCLEWEDIVIDRKLGSIIRTRSNWFERSFYRIPAKNSSLYPIYFVIEVNMTKKNGIELQLRDGKSISISKYSHKHRKHLRDLRLAVSTFLHLEKVENYTNSNDWFFTEDYFDYHSTDDVSESDENETEKLSHFGCRDAIKIIRPAQLRNRQSS